MEDNRWIYNFLKGISTKWNTTSTKIWTQEADSIAYDDNRFIKHRFSW